MMILTVAMLHDLFSVQFLSQPDIWHIIYFMAILCSLYAYSFLFSWLTERHTAKVTAWFAR
jgi:hypothetical protein